MREPYREVAAAILVGTCGHLCLQLRDDIPGILYPGQIGLFGGHREAGETFMACVMREIEEETGQRLPAERFAPLLRLHARIAEGGGLSGEYFVVRDIDVAALRITEGSLLKTRPQDVPALMPRLTPSAAYVMKIFLAKSN